MSSYLDKKGLSEMISYVILVAIALGLSALVFAYLQLYVPKDNPKCQEDISLSISKISCEINHTESNLTLIIKNTGLFKVDGVYLRIGERGKKILGTLNAPEDLPTSVNSKPFIIDLSPQSTISWTKILSTSNYPTGDYTIEAQPAVFIKNKLTICESIVRQDVECKQL